MKKVGFVGVGNMGIGMAKSFLREGFPLTVYDVRKEPLKELATLGAQIAESSQEVGKNQML